MSENGKKWYILRAISGKENKVKETLEAEIKNSDLGDFVFQVLIPTEKIVSVRNGKKVVKERVLYSGYVFVQAILVGEIPHRLSNTTNVIGFLTGKNSKKPEELRDAEVMRMLGTVDEIEEQSDDISVQFYVGEPVKVNHGPFSGFTGEVEEVNNDKKKLKVMVKVFGRKTPLELDFKQVEKE